MDIFVQIPNCVPSPSLVYRKPHGGGHSPGSLHEENEERPVK